MHTDEVWSRYKDRTETWGKVGFSSSKQSGGLRAKFCFSWCAEIPPEKRSIYINVIPWEDANFLAPSPAMDWLKSPRPQLTPKSPMPRVPQGPTTTALPPSLYTQSSNCRFLFQLFSVQRARAVLTVIFPSFLVYRLSNCIWSRQREEINDIAEHLETIIANYS